MTVQEEEGAGLQAGCWSRPPRGSTTGQEKRRRIRLTLPRSRAGGNPSSYPMVQAGSARPNLGLLLELGLVIADGHLEAGRRVVPPEAHSDRPVIDEAPWPALDDGDDAFVPLVRDELKRFRPGDGFEGGEQLARRCRARR